MGESNITLGMKLPIRVVPAEVLMAIKKETGMSLSEIKRRISEDEYIFECPVVDDDGLRFMNRFKRVLSERFGIVPRLFEGDREEPSESFDNLEALHRENERQMGYEEGAL